MNHLEKMISEFISKDKKHPVVVEISGPLSDEMVRRIKKTIRNEPLTPGAAVNLTGSVDAQTVTIPLAAYAELVRCKAQYDAIRDAYTKSPFMSDALLSAVFGQKNGEPAPSEGAPSEEQPNE